MFRRFDIKTKKPDYKHGIAIDIRSIHSMLKYVISVRRPGVQDFHFFVYRPAD